MKDLHEATERLATGTRLGPYEILDLVGQGGMGEVYRARDTRLDRLVAVKILPGGSSGDQGRRRQRFMREAGILSSLNHPNISSIHDIGEHEGRAFLVMEFVEGESLDMRLARRPLSVVMAVTLAAQIADALDAAHRRGFVHRDLKPSNVIVTAAGVKLLDFGIASLWMEPLDPLDQSVATTASDAASVPGTTAYIAPEQLEGRPADPRSDLFALGVVLYEMLAGRRPFAATTRAGLIAAILEKTPDPLALPDGPPVLERVVLRCLEKDPDARWQTARDLSSELAWVRDQLTREVRRGPSRTARRWRLPAAAVLAVATASAGMTMWFDAASSPPSVVRFIVTPPAGVVMAGTSAFALSPDGRHLALVGSSRGGPSLIWVQTLDSYAARPIAGTDDAWHPFWSPDSQSVGFFAGGKLKAATIDGTVRTLADVPQANRASHGAWGPGGVIFNAGASLLWRVPGEGGGATEVALGPGLPAASRLVPSDILPDGRHFLFRATDVPPGSPNSFIGSLDGGPVTPLLKTDSQVQYVEPGYLLYMRNGDLLTQRFNPRALTVGGPPVHVPEPVSLSRLGRAILSAARRDVLAYEAEAALTELVWYDRFGRRLGVLGDPGLHMNPALAPDGRRAVVARFDPAVNRSAIWIVDPALGERALTDAAATADYPIWSTNGDRVIYATDRSGRMRMYEKPADAPASAPAEAVNEPAGANDENWPLDWASQGALVVYQGGNPGIPRWLFAVPTVGRDRLAIPMSSTSASSRVLQEEAQAQVSPDGRWIAYTVDLGRSPQVYVKAFPGGGSVTQVSTAGGFEPKWRGDGQELFYVASDRTIMSVAVRCHMACEIAPPRPLFRVAALGAPLRKGSIRNEYAVTRDGQRFLVNEPVDGTSAYGIRIVVNWQAGVEGTFR